MEDVINNPNERWNRNNLSKNKNISMKVINMNLTNMLGKWDWNAISTQISMEDVIRYPNETWCKQGLSMNGKINMKVIRMNLPNAYRHWNWIHISKHISMEDVINNLDEPWSKYNLSQNKNICMKVINTHLPNATSEWKWDYISMNIKIEDIIDYPNETWNKYGLSQNNNMTKHISEKIHISNGIGRWVYHSMKKHVFIRNHDILSLVKTYNRYNMSQNDDISMYWINFKDRVGVCRDNKWKSDISILCRD
jgi:hypothetical protein